MNRTIFFKNFFMYFPAITTGTLLACATLNSQETLPSDILWQIVIVGLLGGFITSLLIVNFDIPKKEAIVRSVIHYILINCLILGVGYYFGWYDFSLTSVIIMIITIILVYVFVLGISFFGHKQTANRINQELRRRD